MEVIVNFLESSWGMISTIVISLFAAIAALTKLRLDQLKLKKLKEERNKASNKGGNIEIADLEQIKEYGYARSVCNSCGNKIFGVGFFCPNCGERRKDFSGACFPADTKVYTPYGEENINKLSVGSFVFSYDESLGKYNVNRVLRMNSHAKHRILNLYLSNGERVRTTINHRFYSSGNWVKAVNLRVSDKVLITEKNGCVAEAEVERMDISKKLEPVYNIVVEGDFTYFAGGVLASSFTNLRVLRKFLYKTFSYRRIYRSITQ